MSNYKTRTTKSAYECPACGAQETKIIKIYVPKKTNGYPAPSRIRYCIKCYAQWRTIELPDYIADRVVMYVSLLDQAPKLPKNAIDAQSGRIREMKGVKK